MPSAVRIVDRVHAPEDGFTPDLPADRPLRQSVAAYVFSGSGLSLLTAPLIYSLLVPLAILDIWVTAFQWTCFPIYGISRVARAQYFSVDRHRLAYLNAIEKVHFVFCSYATGVVAYAREVGARTEQFWCPIKHARPIQPPHERYHRFVAYGDAHGYHEGLSALRRALRDAPRRSVRR